MKKAQYVELKENVRCEHWEVTDGKNVRSPFLLSCQTSSEEAACVWGGLWKRNTRRCLAITVVGRVYAILWIHKLRWVENERDENSLGVLARRERGRKKMDVSHECVIVFVGVRSHLLSIRGALNTFAVHGHTSADQTQNDYGCNDAPEYWPSRGGFW